MTRKKLSSKRPVKKAAKKIKRPAKGIKHSKKPAKMRTKNTQKTVAAQKTKNPLIGAVEHFFTNISVGVIKLDKTLKAGDTILIQGATTNFKQKVESMQIDMKPVKEAGKGDSIGLKVKKRVREKDKVYLVK